MFAEDVYCYMLGIASIAIVLPSSFVLLVCNRLYLGQIPALHIFHLLIHSLLVITMLGESCMQFFANTHALHSN